MSITMSEVEVVVEPPPFPSQIIDPPSTPNTVVIPERGAPGPKGDEGDQGDQGIQGPEGPSAYEVAVANGFVGTEAEWLDSIRGEPGPASTYTDYNFASPSTLWVINHGLGTYALQVETFDQSGNPIEGYVTWPDPDTVHVEYYYPTAGVARIIS